MDRKIEFKRTAVPSFTALRAMKRLRGTLADPFRWAEVRKVERELPGEYVAAVERALAALTPSNHAAAVVLAELPEMVRGYEDIKLASVERYRAELARRLEAFGS